MHDQLAEALYRAVEYGTGDRDRVINIPDDCVIKLSDDHGGHLLNGSVITAWSDR
jgi:hypothetical protein